MEEKKIIPEGKDVLSLLSKIQKELKAPKNQYNSFGLYKFRSCEDILEAVKPLLNCGTLTLNDEIVMIGDRYYVKATATLMTINGTISTSALARESENKKGMDSAQITGATSSYARKYALNGLFCIDDTKDADTTNNGNGNGEIKYIDISKQNEIVDLVLSVNGDLNKFLKLLKVSSIDKMTENDYKKAIPILNKKYKEIGERKKRQLSQTRGENGNN